MGRRAFVAGSAFIAGVVFAILAVMAPHMFDVVYEHLESAAISRDIADAECATKLVLHVLEFPRTHSEYFPEYNAVIRKDLTLYQSTGNRVFSVKHVNPIDHEDVVQIDRHELPRVIASTGLYEWFGREFITGQRIVVRTGRADATGSFQLYLEFEGVNFMVEERL